VEFEWCLFVSGFVIPSFSPVPVPVPVPVPAPEVHRRVGSVNVFDHEKLDVYNAAIDFVALANAVAEHLPRGRGYLADQLQRAATSIPLNIAEGAGEFSPSEKARFYRIAKRSATECAATLHVCSRLALVDDATLHAGRDLLLRIVSMLISMIRRSEENGKGTGTGTGTGTK